jgi:hypothetical protein
VSVIDSKKSQKGSNGEGNMNLKKTNLVRPRHKFAPFTRADRKERRNEVYKLHFEYGMPATRIAELMKVDRNTINNDLKILYNKAIRGYNSEMTFDEVIEKQLLRLETQRDRLCLYLCDAKDITSKITIERMITDIDLKVIGVIDKMNQNIVQHWNAVMEQVNKIAEKEKLKTRFTSLFELYRISIDTRQDLDKLREKVWGKQEQGEEQQKEQKQEQQKQERKDYAK